MLVRPGALPAECRRRGIVPQGYSALGSGSSAVLEAPLARAIGAAHGVSSAQARTKADPSPSPASGFLHRLVSRDPEREGALRRGCARM